jgi:type I restriction enzyme S subunit
MRNGTIAVDALRNCHPERAAKFEKTRLSAGEILITKDGTIGVTAIVPPELEGGNTTQHVLRLSVHPSFSNHYIRIAIDSPIAQAWMRGETKGVALQGVNVRDFQRMPLPIPPPAEQYRIVAKVEELEKKWEEANKHIQELKTKIEALKSSILDAAFKGKL